MYENNSFGQKKNKTFPVAALILALVFPFTYNILEHIFYVAQIINLSLVERSLGPTSRTFEENFYFWDAFFCFFAGLIFAVIYFKIYVKQKDGSKEKMPRFKEGRKLTWGLAFQGILITLGMGGISQLWFIFVEKILTTENLLGMGESLENFSNTWSGSTESYLWVYLSVVVLGPIVEELVFRGIQFYYAKKVSSGFFAIFITALIFGLWHREPVQVVYTFFMGIALGIVFYYSGSMLLVIGMHILNNFLSQFLADLNNDALFEVFGLLYYAAIIPALVLLIYLYEKAKKRNKQQSAIRENIPTIKS